MGDIFICHTLYHVLIALVRALRSRPGKSTLVLSTCVPEAETLRAKLLDAAPDLWNAVLIVDEEKLDAQNSESDFYRLRHPFRKPYFTLPKGHVYISNDWSALGRYLQRERRVYTLCEDTFGGTLDPDQHLLDEQRANPRGPYRYWGDSSLIESCALYSSFRPTSTPAASALPPAIPARTGTCFWIVIFTPASSPV